MLVQPDGKILIGGNVRAVNGVIRGGLARLNADGTLDTAFNSGSGVDGAVFALGMDSAGNIYAAGGFSNFNGVERNSLAKLNPNGDLDQTFDPGVGPSSIVYAIAVDEASGSIVIGGGFPRYAGTTVGRIARLNATTAALDTSFNNGGSGFPSLVRALQLGLDGKYYVGGNFFSFNGVPQAGVARLLSDGSRDTTFANPGNGLSVLALALQPDGKVLVGGPASSSLPSRLLRLSATGELDTIFDVGTGAKIAPINAYNQAIPAAVTALAIQQDGRPLVGGIFNQFNGAPRVALARLTDAPLAFMAFSRKTHGAAGVFDINLPLTGFPGVECRSNLSGQYQIVLNFGRPVIFDIPYLGSGTGQVNTSSGNGTDTVTVNLTGVANAQRITLTLANTSSGTPPANLNVPVGILFGDTTGNGSVSATDLGQIKAVSGQSATAANFRSDVNASGSINSTDIGQAKGASGTTLP